MSPAPPDVLDRLSGANPLPEGALAGEARSPAAREAMARIVATPVDDRPEGRPGRARRIAGVALGAVGVAGVAAVLAVLLVSSPGPPAPERLPAQSTGRVSVLDAPQRAADRLPGWVLADRVTTFYGVRPETTRLALTSRGRRFWVARGRLAAPTGVASTCMIDATVRPPGPGSRHGSPGGVNCQPDAVFDRHLMIAVHSRSARGVDVSGVVPDGFTRVVVGDRIARVTRNVFVLRGVDPQDPVQAEGPAGQRTYTLAGGGPAPPSIDSPALPVSALSRPLRPSDRLPERVLRSANPNGAVRHAEARLVAVQGGVRYFIAPSRPGSLFMFQLRETRAGGRVQTGSVGGLRRPTEARPFSFSAGAVRRAEYAPSTVTLTGLAADGYDSIEAGGRRARIVGNFFVLDGIEVLAPIPVTVNGPRGRATGTVPSFTFQNRTTLRSLTPARPPGG